MLSGGTLASFLTLPLSLLVSVLFCLSPSVFVAWLWLLSWGLCPPGVLGTTLVDLCSLCEDMRSMYAFAPGPFASSCLNAGPRLFWFPALFSFLVFRFSFRLYPHFERVHMRGIYGCGLGVRIYLVTLKIFLSAKKIFRVT